MQRRLADYAAALLPDRHRVCGVLLKPHTLGHALLLRRLCNPYAVGSGVTDHGFGHTVQAAFVCSRDWVKAAAGVDRWTSVIWIRFRSFLRWHDQATDRVALLQYLADAWRHPATLAKRNGTPSGVDFIQALVTDQRSRWGMDIDQALNVPVGVAILERLEFLEREGVLRCWSARDEAALTKLDEVLARTSQANTTN